MKRKKPKASAQGDFDNLCGIYSLVNVIVYLYDGRLRRPALKNALIQTYSQRWCLQELLLEGTDEEGLDYLIEEVLMKGFYHQRYPILVRKPFVKTPRIGAKRMLEQVAEFLARERYTGTRVVILGTVQHWYLVKRMDATYLYFFDSAGFTRAYRRSFSRKAEDSRYQLFPSCIYFIERTMEV